MKMYHYWDLGGEYQGVSDNKDCDFSKGGTFVHQEFEPPEFPGLPEPELEDGIYRVKFNDMIFCREKRGGKTYDLEGGYRGVWKDYEVISRLVEEEV